MFFALSTGKRELISQILKVHNSESFHFRLLGIDEFADLEVSMPKVDADAKIKPEKGKPEEDSQTLEKAADEDSSDSESESEPEGEEPKKKRPKEKVGFRDRKVIALTGMLHGTSEDSANKIFGELKFA